MAIVDRVHIKKAIHSFSESRVLILGDVMIDRYLTGSVHRISPEAPVPILAHERSFDKPGGAANVAMNAISLGAQVMVVSVVGNDNERKVLAALLEDAGVRTHFISDNERKTTIKTRVLAGQHHLMRVDFEDNHNLSKTVNGLFIQAVKNALEQFKPNIVILQDYEKGLFFSKNISQIIELCHSSNAFIAADPKDVNFWEYKNVDFFKPNLKEVETALSKTLGKDSLVWALTELQDKLSNKWTMITLSEHGLFLAVDSKSDIFATTQKEIVDVCGAGDAVLAVAPLAIRAGLSMQEVAFLSNLSGGIVCRHSGVYEVNQEDLLSSLDG